METKAKKEIIKVHALDKNEVLKAGNFAIIKSNDTLSKMLDWESMRELLILQNDYINVMQTAVFSTLIDDKNDIDIENLKTAHEAIIQAINDGYTKVTSAENT